MFYLFQCFFIFIHLAGPLEFKGKEISDKVAALIYYTITLTILLIQKLLFNMILLFQSVACVAAKGEVNR